LLLRFDASGTLDPTFGAQGVVAPIAAGTEDVRDIDFTSDGRIVVVGTFSATGGTGGPTGDILVEQFLP